MPLDGPLLGLLRDYIETLDQRTGYLFPGRRAPHIHRWTIWDLLKRLAPYAGIDPKNIWPHALRSATLTEVALKRGIAPAKTSHETDEAYPRGLVAKLAAWPNLRLLHEGKWPDDSELPEGYRGEGSETAPYEHAIVAWVDLSGAIDRLPGPQRRLAERAFLRGDTAIRWGPLIEAIWREVNWPA